MIRILEGLVFLIIFIPLFLMLSTLSLVGWLLFGRRTL